MAVSCVGVNLLEDTPAARARLQPTLQARLRARLPRWRRVLNTEH